MATESMLGPLPLVLGVTGHRDLREGDRARLFEVVAQILAGYRKRLPHTPIVLLSPLADGADRLVARAALHAGAKLVAALPMDAEKFKATLTDSGAGEDFDDLLARATTRFVVPPLNAELDWSTAAPELLYSNCGAYVASRCTELIALWDGQDQAGDAGTAQDVRFMLEGVGEPLVPTGYDLDPRLTGPVVRVVTPRMSNPIPVGAPFSVERLFPHFSDKELDFSGEYDRVLTHIEAYNVDVLEIGGGVAAAGAQMQSLQSLTEQISRKYQRRTYAMILGMLAMVFAAVVSFNLYTGGMATSLSMVAAYITILIATFALYRFSQKRAWQDRYQDYRSLAEAMRVSTFWTRAGITASVAEEVERMQRGEIDWLPIAIRALIEPWCRTARNADVAVLDSIFKDWVADQAAWYAGRVAQKKRYSTYTRMAATVLFIFGGAATLVVALWPVMQRDEHLKHYILFASGLLAGLSGIASYYADKRGWTEEVQEYDRVGALFARARKKMAGLLAAPLLSPETSARIQVMLYDLGREALRENINWRNMHRQRPIKLPHA
ncbi:MAG: DUF4231 domain-containing protein [Candidatus Eremiobacteraeota bacterium]|nr:DUF4231 domain-containing protein [Candidatus Eremiobacteraeota bacterium]